MTLRRVRSVTKAEAAAQTIRGEIREGRLRPGTRLTLQELAADLDMSYTPVREALRQLQAEGLVEYRPHHGTVVADYSRDRAEDVYLLRGVLEPLASSLAAERASAEDLSEIEARLAELNAALEAGRMRDVPALNARLHKRIYATAGSPLLQEFIDRLWNGVPFQAFSLTGRFHESAAEHVAIVDALLVQDADRAAEEMRDHIAKGARAALASLDAMADPP
ncbi:MAG: FCD domain-containing protein [Streptosporangiales bacterium]|nr:FCD domain-containing protein [Streptosporangiales bacterium]